MTRTLVKMDRLRSAIAKPFVVNSPQPAARVLTREGLMHFALSTGNLDPLYFDEAYALASPRGRLIPPPTWYTQVMDPHVGCQAMYTRLALDNVDYLDGAPLPADPGDSGPPLYFLDNLRSFDGGIGFDHLVDPMLGDEFRLTGRVTDVVAKTSRRLGEFAVLTGDLDYLGADDTVLIRGHASSLVYSFDNVQDQYSDSTSNTRDSVQTDSVVSPVRAMGLVNRRGAQPRFWEDVSVGEAIDPLFKGTLDPAEIAVHAVAYGRHDRADKKIREAWDLLLAGEGLEAAQLYREIASDEEFNFGVARHLNTAEATSEGAPGAYDIGTQRAAWAAQAVTDWIGDAGQVTSIALQIRGFVVIGESVWCKGQVAEKFIADDNRHCARLDLWVENHRAERVSVGSAVVSLVTREDPAEKATTV